MEWVRHLGCMGSEGVRAVRGLEPQNPRAGSYVGPAPEVPGSTEIDTKPSGEDVEDADLREL